MTNKKDKELMVQSAELVLELVAMNKALFERLYQRAGDAWQFKSSVDELERRSVQLVADMNVVPDVTPEPEPEEDGDDGGMEEVAGLS